MSLAPYLSGLTLGLSLIIAIGAQNAFVLRQGLRGEYVFWICLVCTLSDASLIIFGVSSFRRFVLAMPWLEPVMRYGGVVFLLWYGYKSARAAFVSTDAMDLSNRQAGSLKSAVATCLALTWLNPHVYLDTIVLLGSLSTRFPGNEWLFGAGAATGSFCFFFSLGYGARLLRPLFAQPRAWRVLEGVIALVMWGCALQIAFM